jgi:NAD(P)-dependent dehydrogenase (short-subunit alcohol dehydrogenase family)
VHGWTGTNRPSTPMTQGESGFTKALETSIAVAPMNRRGTPQEIADACLFLCSSKASFVQGHAMVSSMQHFWNIMLIISRLLMEDIPLIEGVNFQP